MQALGIIVPTIAPLAIKIIEKLVSNDQPEAPNPQIIHVPQYLCCCNNRVNDHGYCDTCKTRYPSPRKLKKSNSPIKSKSESSTVYDNGKLKRTSKSARSPNTAECKKSPNRMSRSRIDPNSANETTLKVLNRKLEYGIKDFGRRPISEKLRATLDKPLPYTEYMLKSTQSEDASEESTSSSLFNKDENLYTNEKIQESIAKAKAKAAKKASEAAKNEEESRYGSWLRTPSIPPVWTYSNAVDDPNELYRKANGLTSLEQLKNICRCQDQVIATNSTCVVLPKSSASESSSNR
ncbi:uncharacterized protein LOC107266092 [Cephus cinctus]|uniref:Uncharacterized protein LOC107266092 n=1 Tax=Cephus cinctus TaxID=211228 RepID=A0AAJ7BQ89_CEPCN|nr:uncharacterized protein LOC107266092 [Cephus cinctus]